MSPTYNLADHADRVRYVADQPTPRHRTSALRNITTRYGELASQSVIEALHNEAKERVA